MNRNATTTVINKLNELKETVNGFEYSDYGMQEAKSNLLETIEELYKGLDAINRNGFLSNYYSSMSELANVFGGGKKVEAPESLKRGITQMDSVIRERYFQSLPESIFQLERMALGNKKITLDEYKEIRAYTLRTVRDSLLANIYYEAQKFKEASIDNFMEAYSNSYPINDAYAYFVRERSYAGILYRFMLIGKGEICDYENIKPGDCNWGYLFMGDNDKAICRYECLGADTIDYRIGDVKLADNQLSCVFTKEYSHISADELVERDEKKILELVNAGKMQKIKKIEIKLEGTNCSQYHFLFKTYYELSNGNQQEERYVCRLASLKEYMNFTNNLKEIGKIKQLFE
ncbi:MAG: hypothetical protein NC410_11675 [Oscillibacter sp.]|nr:hypothetical protein [Oscillibacter sp.]